ncbi:MAG: CarD family transcriptional regulator [Deltaproteobacteria bacterium]|nr:CarD family transcriptional regulator [Deltaproteobacteria bacterium]
MEALRSEQRDTDRRLIHGKGVASTKMSGQFKIGDKAVYPGHGVAQISGLEWREISGTRREFYILKIVNSDMKVLVPVESLSNSGLRNTIDVEDAPEVFEVLKDPNIAVTEEPWNRRSRVYLNMLASNSLCEIAKVLRDLHRITDSKKLSRCQSRLYNQARNLLVTELSLVYGCEPSLIEQKLQDALDTLSAHGE